MVFIRRHADDALLVSECVLKCSAHALALLLTRRETENVSARLCALGHLFHELCCHLTWLRSGCLARARSDYGLARDLVRRAVIDGEHLGSSERVPDDRIRRRGHHDKLEW